MWRGASAKPAVLFVHCKPHMDKLIEKLRERAARDAERFRTDHGGEAPNEKWIENSYTAALPLVKDDVGIDPGLGPHPQLFAAYAEEVARTLGIGRVREDGEWDRREDATTLQEPTPGEK